MQKDSSFFDDIAKMATGAAGGLLEMKRELEQMIGYQLEKLLQKSNFASREEFDTLMDALAKIQEQQQEISARLDALEKSR